MWTEHVIVKNHNARKSIASVSMQEYHVHRHVIVQTVATNNNKA